MKPDETPNPDGAPSSDPTRNVRELVDAETVRQDDLRLQLEKLLDTSLESLKELTDAKFNGIEREFSLIESRRIEQKNDTKTAVDAALSAAERAVREQAAASEKAIIKSETSAAEQSKQNAQTFSAQLRGVEATVGDLKERVGKFENQQQGRSDNRTDARMNIGTVVAIIMAIITFVSLIVSAFAVISVVSK